MKNRKSRSLSLLLIVLIISCQSDDAEPLNVIGLIKGGHQVEYSDTVVNLSYGIFNQYGEPNTSFKSGEEIVFSFWLENKIPGRLNVLNFQDNPFMDVYSLAGSNQDEFYGRPYEGLCAYPNVSTVLENDIYKVDIPWMSDLPIQFDCPSVARDPLPAGEYVSSFVESFSFFLDDGQLHRTDTLDFSIQFEVY